MLRLMTLNLNYRIAKHGPWEARRALIADAVRHSAADVIALQAVERVGASDQAAELGELLGYGHIRFAPATIDNGVERGSALVSRLPLADVAIRRLSRLTNQEDANDRVVLRAEVDAGGYCIALYNAHFSWVAPQALDNVRETLAFRHGGPAVLLGDFNNGPESPALQALTRAAWVDPWAHFHADSGYT